MTVLVAPSGFNFDLMVLKSIGCLMIELYPGANWSLTGLAKKSFVSFFWRSFNKYSRKRAKLFVVDTTLKMVKKNKKNVNIC